ncbi:MAG: hypothetical protein JNK22_17265, partial [Rhodocyclaceae bacterium]|nr:hypothetical protein [Rhodocyclaceae bacterium]
MSLINRMLRDLDARRAPADELPNQVRPLPVAAARSPAWALPGVALLVVAAGAVAWLYWGAAQAPARPVPAMPPIVPPAPVAAAPAPAPEPVPAPALPDAGTAVPAAGAPTAPAAADPGPAAAAVLAESGLKVASELSRPPEPRAEPAPAARPKPAAAAPASPAPPQPVPQAAAPAPTPPAAKVPEANPAGKASGPAADPPAGRIDKQPIAVTPREKAEEALRRAQQAGAQGRGLQAQAELQAALREDPSYATARLLLAQAFVE